MLLELGEQGGRNSGSEPIAGFLERQARATVAHQKVADLGFGRSLGFVVGELSKDDLLTGVERSAVERFEKVRVAKVFAQQADVAANGALMSAQGGSDFGDFGVVVRGKGVVHRWVRAVP